MTLTRNLLIVTLLILGGCGHLSACKQTPISGSQVRDNNSTQSDDSMMAQGQMTPTNNNSDILMAAPHGTFDLGTDQILNDLCPALRWNCLLVTGFRSFAHAINVNRPTEGVRMKADEEVETPEAHRVYDMYHGYFDQLYRKDSSRWYIEIHGNADACCVHALEIATVGVDADTAKILASNLRNSLTAAGISPNELDIRIEPLNSLRFMAQGNKTKGVLHDVRRAIHIEAPSFARKERRPQYTAALLDFFRGLDSLDRANTNQEPQSTSP